MQHVRLENGSGKLPMDKDFDSQISSDVADIKNVGDGRLGGAITAAKLLERFVRGIPWIHVDIAGPAFADKPRPSIAGGGTGSMVRSFIEFTNELHQRTSSNDTLRRIPGELAVTLVF